MRYMLQGAVMLGDVLFTLAGAWLLYVVYIGEVGPQMLIIVGLGVSAWLSVGGFEAWHPKTIREFMRNAKDLGL